MSARIPLIGFMLELNAFSPVTDEAEFREKHWLEGEAILDDARSATPRDPAASPASAAPWVARASLSGAVADQVIANGRRIGDGGRGAPTTAASCALRASISARQLDRRESSARLATMAEMVWASSGVSRPAPTSSSRSA